MKTSLNKDLKVSSGFTQNNKQVEEVSSICGVNSTLHLGQQGT